MVIITILGFEILLFSDLIVDFSYIFTYYKNIIPKKYTV